MLDINTMGQVIWDMYEGSRFC